MTVSLLISRFQVASSSLQRGRTTSPIARNPCDKSLQQTNSDDTDKVKDRTAVSSVEPSCGGILRPLKGRPGPNTRTRGYDSCEELEEDQGRGIEVEDTSNRHSQYEGLAKTTKRTHLSSTKRNGDTTRSLSTKLTRPNHTNEFRKNNDRQIDNEVDTSFAHDSNRAKIDERQNRSVAVIVERMNTVNVNSNASDESPPDYGRKLRSHLKDSEIERAQMNGKNIDKASNLKWTLRRRSNRNSNQYYESDESIQSDTEELADAGSANNERSHRNKRREGRLLASDECDTLGAEDDIQNGDKDIKHKQPRHDIPATHPQGQNKPCPGMLSL